MRIKLGGDAQGFPFPCRGNPVSIRIPTHFIRFFRHFRWLSSGSPLLGARGRNHHHLHKEKGWGNPKKARQCRREMPVEVRCTAQRKDMDKRRDRNERGKRRCTKSAPIRVFRPKRQDPSGRWCPMGGTKPPHHAGGEIWYNSRCLRARRSAAVFGRHSSGSVLRVKLLRVSRRNSPTPGRTNQFATAKRSSGET